MLFRSVYHKKELENKVQELRSLKAMKEELENELKAVEHEIISYMTENDLDTEITDMAKITYKPQSRMAIATINRPLSCERSHLVKLGGSQKESEVKRK